MPVSESETGILANASSHSKPAAPAPPKKATCWSAVMFLLAILILSLSVAVPSRQEAIQRDRELETMQRGKQYIRAIQLYYRKFDAYPPNLDALVKTNEIRFLRKKYVDPTTGKETGSRSTSARTRCPRPGLLRPAARRRTRHRRHRPGRRKQGSTGLEPGARIPPAALFPATRRLHPQHRNGSPTPPATASPEPQQPLDNRSTSGPRARLAPPAPASPARPSAARASSASRRSPKQSILVLQEEEPLQRVGVRLRPAVGSADACRAGNTAVNSGLASPPAEHHDVPVTDTAAGSTHRPELTPPGRPAQPTTPAVAAMRSVFPIHRLLKRKRPVPNGDGPFARRESGKRLKLPALTR